MKINIITFNYALNVGASLQEYALYTYLKNLGHDVKVVDYRPEYLIKKRPKNKLLYLLFLLNRGGFNRFQKRIEKTRVCKNIQDLETLSDPDVFICGSDQIWNPEITQYDRAFFLDFNTKAKKIAYAGSVGKDILNEYEKKQIIDLTNNLQEISIREEELLAQIPEFKERSVTVVSDPVFLLKKDEYEKIAYDTHLKKYVLIYEAERNPKCAELAKIIAEKKKLQTIQINRINNRYQVDKLIPCVCPERFLGLIKSADYVVTNSFHGVALSIIMEKQFLYIPLKERASRVNTLLNKCGLKNRTNIDECINQNINYTEINKKVDFYKESSEQFIKKVLEE